jgi:hypothetical protein
MFSTSEASEEAAKALPAMSQLSAATGPFRTAQPGRTQRDRTHSFSFDGHNLQGYAGESVAATESDHFRI